MMMGSLGQVGEVAVDIPCGIRASRWAGQNQVVAALPFVELRRALAGSELVVVCDRALSWGGAAGRSWRRCAAPCIPWRTHPTSSGTPWAWGPEWCSPRL